MVYRIYVEKKEGLQHEAKNLLSDLRDLLALTELTDVRILNRYDVEGITEELFAASRYTIFAEPQLDDVTETLDNDSASAVFAVEYLPGQFDQRADSAAQCVQMLAQTDRPTVRTAKVYRLYGALTDEQIAAVKHYVINPVESREASLDTVTTLQANFDVPEKVATVEGFCKKTDAELAEMLRAYGFAMDLDDIRFCQNYFANEEHRDPTMTEMRMIDTYWSDHCRHTTFLTTIDSVKFEDALLEEAYNDYIASRKSIGRTKPINLMDVATIAVRTLKKAGKLPKLDESEEINACTVKIKVNHDGKEEDWLLLFKNETHNHPTEIEPFGGAATCIGGAIRDPLSGRSYVYAAMRVTGAADPTLPLSETMAGKLPQRKIVTTAAAGYSSYGNQIGLATGQVSELYHPGYVAKRMEIGAVVGAAPQENVRREVPAPGDAVILLGGRTGRDGCGGATGSSKSHTLESLESCGAEVQKGNAPEERKLQRLFRDPNATRLIKRCNDFGAGGVSVAVGELADGLSINLNAVPKKYEGLDGTELAISESQERMAVVVEAKDVDAFLALAAKENLEATVIASVQAEPRLTMQWNGQTIVNLSREFLNSNGAEKHIDIEVAKPQSYEKVIPADFKAGMEALVTDLNICSQRGLSERFDSTIGAGTVLMPFGGKHQLTPPQAMVHKIPVEHGDTDTCSYMAWGYNPYVTEKSPYHGAYLAVLESVCKLIATGATFEDVYLTFQEYFEKPLKDPKRWGKPLAALLGAYRAQMDYQIASIGGKDSMSGSFEKIDVPPTLVSFAVTTGKTAEVVSPEFKGAGHKVVALLPEYDANGLPTVASELKLFETVNALLQSKQALAVATPTMGGIAGSIFTSMLGNGIGVKLEETVTNDLLFGYHYGAFVVELATDADVGVTLGYTTAEKTLQKGAVVLDMAKLQQAYDARLEKIYPTNAKEAKEPIPAFSHQARTWAKPKTSIARPRVLIPIFPGTNCEYDSAKAVEKAGGEAQLFVIRNLNAQAVAESVDAFAKAAKNAQAIFLPGGFSGGDEPDGSGKFITSFFRNGAVKEQVHALLQQRDGLMCGICNGFQALIKLGLVPYGEIRDTDAESPTLTFNSIGRHQSRLVRTRIASNKSVWLQNTNVGDVYTVAISHGEGRFLASQAWVDQLAKNGQIATQYVDLDNNPTSNILYNPNNSVCAIEGITSPDGRVFGKMGHSERIGTGLYANVEGNYDIGMFRACVEYFK